MSHATLASTPPTRALIRVLLTLGAVSAALHSGSPRALAAAHLASEEMAAGIPRMPTYCHLITRFGVDFLSDEVAPSQAFQVSMGELGAGELAPFRTFALTHDPRFYYDVTFEYRATQVAARAPRGGGDVAGRFYRAADPARPTLYYAPRRQSREDRIAFLEFSYQCVRPRESYPQRFILTLRGTDRPEPEDRVTSPGAAPPEVLSPAHPELNGAWQSAGPVRSGTRRRVTGTLRVSNDGQAEAGPTRLVLFLSADGVPGPEDQLLGFRDVSALAAGASMDLAVDYPVRSTGSFAATHLIALIDSSNTAEETNERDNVVVSRPLVER